MKIFIPATLLAIYTMLFYFYMGYRRRQAVMTRAINPKFYRTYSEGQEPDDMRLLSRHAANLLEMPMLFYAVVVMLFVSGAVSTALIGLAWAFVALRFVHAFVHLGSNFVLHRFLVFGVSLLVLLIMWLWLLVHLIGA